MNKFIAIVLGLAVLQIVSAVNTEPYKGPEVVFEKGFFGCGARISGQNTTDRSNAPPLTVQLIACELTNWKNQKVYTVQQGQHNEFTKTALCDENYFIDDTFAIFYDQLKYFEQNTIEVQDFTFHCNNAGEYSTLGITDEFKQWELYEFFFTTGFQVVITREAGFFDSYKHVQLEVFYSELNQKQKEDYTKIIDGNGYGPAQEEILDVQPASEEAENGEVQCQGGLVFIDGECQKVCQVGQVNDRGVCRDRCSVKTDVVLEGRCVRYCPQNWSVEDGVCVAECGTGRTEVNLTRQQYANLVGASRKQHKTFVKMVKKIRRSLRK